MTLPTRPAPAPPGSRAQDAAANANATLEQLRLQLQQHQQLQRSQHATKTITNATIQKLTIKLPPPPPKQPMTPLEGVGSITRKYPQARYAPATNWDDSPFEFLDSYGNTHSLVLDGTTAAPFIKPPATTQVKKIPPPRPPPPKMLPKKCAAPALPIQPSNNVLTNLFHLKKKSSRTSTLNNFPRNSVSTSLRSSATNNLSTSTSMNADWNNAWNTTTPTQHTSTITEAQLISFDSPPSSPTFTQKSNSDCLSVDSFSSDSNFSSPNNGSVSQPESGFEDDFSASARRSRPATASPLDPWDSIDPSSHTETLITNTQQDRYDSIGTAPVRNLSTINTRIQSSGDNPLCNGKSLLPPTLALNMPTIIKPKISQKPKAPKPPPLLVKSSLLESPSICSDNSHSPPSPPMPRCAPPPPPLQASVFAASISTDFIPAKPTISVLDATGEGNTTPFSDGVKDYDSSTLELPYGIAMYDFDSVEEGDLCFKENEKIYLLEQVSAEWYKGRSRSGCEGIFPINYIEIKVPLSSSNIKSRVNSTQSSSAFTNSTYPTTSFNNNLKVRALYHFRAEVEGDLELKENDVVTILHRINEDWLYGEINDRRGQFPANFLEYVPTNIPMP